jgi:hypothetical protein
MPAIEPNRMLATTTVEIIARFWTILGEMAPYLMAGFTLAGLLSVLIPTEWVARHLGGRGIWPVVKAALFGIPLPLCSCSVIPVAASLRKSGAGRGATAAFLIATPMTGADSILVNLRLLGPVFAVFTPLAALVSGCLGGWAMNLAHRAAADPPAPAACGCAGACGGRPETPPAAWWRRALRHGFVTLPRDIARELLIGLLAAGAITALVPGDFFSRDLGGGLAAKLLVMLAGIPLYVCASASIPVAAALMGTGLSPGGALVFLMTGPATNAATLLPIRQVLGRRSVGVFLAVVAAAALAMGTLLDAVYSGPPARQMSAAAEAAGGLFAHASAAALLALLVWAGWFGRRAAKK